MKSFGDTLKCSSQRDVSGALKSICYKVFAQVSRKARIWILDSWLKACAFNCSTLSAVLSVIVLRFEDEWDVVIAFKHLSELSHLFCKMLQGRQWHHMEQFWTHRSIVTGITGSRCMGPLSPDIQWGCIPGPGVTGLFMGLCFGTSTHTCVDCWSHAFPPRPTDATTLPQQDLSSFEPF